MTLRCLVIDDELHAVELLERFILRTPGLELTGSFKNPVLGLAAAAELDADVAFLDIDMPELTGLALAPLLPARTKIVFTTSFREFGPEAFQLKAVDYLLKPFLYERFLLSVSRLREERSASGHFFVRTGSGQLSRVVPEEILYISALLNYAEIHSKNDKVVTHGSLDHILSVLPGSSFLRIHRSYAINLNAVIAVQGDEVELLGGKKLTVGRSYQVVFRSRIKCLFKQ